MSFNLTNTLKNIEVESKSFIDNHSYIVEVLCNDFYDKFSSLIKSDLGKLTKEKCNLYKKSLPLMVNLHDSTKELLKCHDSGVNFNLLEIDLSAFISTYKNNECITFLKSWSQAYQENQNLKSELNNLNNNIQSFCELSGQDDFTIELCEALI